MFAVLGINGTMNILDKAIEGIKSVGSSIVSAVGDKIVEALSTFLGKVLYYLVVKGMLSLVNMLYSFFSVFAGLSKVEYDGSKDYLINIFFSNSTINKIYWGMALIGILMVFVFAIIAVIRKTFDLYDKQQQPMSHILTNCLKSIFIILVLSFFVSFVVNASNVLLQSVTYIFNNADSFGKKSTITYSDAQYATMARCINTIGNYSLNPAYNTRYNLNSCFNEIRADLQSLESDGIFDVYYVTKDDDGNEVNTWQSVLQKIVNSASLQSELYLDVYYDEVEKALLDAMTIINTDSSFYPLESYKASYETTSTNVGLDKVIFLVGTYSSAKNEGYNENPSFDDGLRAPFYNGEKSIYNLDEVSEAFDIKITGLSYLMMGFLAYMTIKNLWRCIIACIVRMFTIIGLYIIAPPFIGTMPFDDGGKFKQWMTAFIVQVFGIFGTVIPMRLMILFVPIIMSSDLVLFESTSFNLIGKALLIVGCMEVCNRFSGVVTGILSDNAGYQSVLAGNTDQFADTVGGKVHGVATGIAGGAVGAAATVTGLKTVGNAVKGAGSSIMGGMAEHGGLVGGIAHAIGGSKKDNGGGSLPKNNGNMGDK